ncbi:universal stress protein [Halodesulfovibrio sp.]|uniref:universal stress protein n=1 Tax=Halodesulfovibrio sp. TaxID=1912772 RepID=UPI0025BAE7DD|nr:universal stress protein [Halodesulfovibrio sp.]
MKPQRILVPVDGSISSKNAAKYAAYLSVQTGAKVTILNVYGPISQLLTGRGLKIIKDELSSHAEEILQEYKAMMEECGATVDTIAKAGETGNTILNTADKINSDLIVMGSRGHSAIEGAIMGSVAIKVLHGANCPVLVTRHMRHHYPEHACFA